MVKHICIIDDQIPSSIDGVEDANTKICFHHFPELLKRDWGKEKDLKNLITDIVGKKEELVLSGFRNPEFFLQENTEELYHPDIIIYDWEYVGSESPEQSKQDLLEILQSTFCVIGIYSRLEKKDEIDETLNSPEFQEFKGNRIKFVHKEDPNSHNELINQTTQMYNSNFGFKFGKELRSTALKSINSVLIELGKLEIDKAYSLLSDEGINNVDLAEMISNKVEHFLKENEEITIFLKENGVANEKAEALKSFISTKLKDELNSNNYELEIQQLNDSPRPEISSRLWSYRLYYRPTDSAVRKGDIVLDKRKNQKSSKLYLVVSADCDLSRFWQKNLGIINLVPLYEILESKQYILDQLRVSGGKVFNCKVSSISNEVFQSPSGQLLLPFIRFGDQYKNYLLFPKEITHFKIIGPQNIQNEKALEYKHCTDYERVCTLSEPFLTPVVEHIFSTIAGYGSPDYTVPIKTLLSDALRGIQK